LIIVGEKINTSRRGVEEAVRNRDAAFIIGLAHEQAEAGADYIDVNAGTFLEQEVDCLCWLTETVQKEVALPLCLDSPNPKALSEAMKVHQGEPLVNSISLEEDRLRLLLPVVTQQPCSVVALCMAKTSMPVTTEERVDVGSELVNRLTGEGFPREKIYVDPLIHPVSVNTDMGTPPLEQSRE
jgi:5-methyltetrahydrofolate--homocysteine methyltransferase